MINTNFFIFNYDSFILIFYSADHVFLCAHLWNSLNTQEIYNKAMIPTNSLF